MSWPRFLTPLAGLPPGANLPSGIGGMWFAAHPLKFFNVFLLIWISLVMMYRLRKGKTVKGVRGEEDKKN